MEKSIEVRLQHFAEMITQEIQHKESQLLIGLSASEEKRCMILSEGYQEILEKFEKLFEDVLYTDN